MEKLPQPKMNIEDAFKTAKLVANSGPLKKLPSEPLARDMMICSALLVMTNRVIELEARVKELEILLGG